MRYSSATFFAEYALLFETIIIFSLVSSNIFKAKKSEVYVSNILGIDVKHPLKEHRITGGLPQYPIYATIA